MIRIKHGEMGLSVMPHSEVCMSMRVSGKSMSFRFEIVGYLNNGIDGIAKVQLLDDNGNHFSSRILASEAGVYQDDSGFYYYQK